MGLIQYKIGDKFEQEVATEYAKRGYFVYKLPTGINGTVFDFIMVRNNTALFIECKHVKGSKLRPSCGLLKKKDELDHFCHVSGSEVMILIRSDELGGVYTITWTRARELFSSIGYIDIAQDCTKVNF